MTAWDNPLRCIHWRCPASYSQHRPYSSELCTRIPLLSFGLFIAEGAVGAEAHDGTFPFTSVAPDRLDQAVAANQDQCILLGPTPVSPASCFIEGCRNRVLGMRSIVTKPWGSRWQTLLASRGLLGPVHNLMLVVILALCLWFCSVSFPGRRLWSWLSLIMKLVVKGKHHQRFAMFALSHRPCYRLGRSW